VVSFWQAPEGVRVLPDGTWRVGGFPIIHTPSLRHLKSRLVFTDDGAFIDDGNQRLPVAVDGPAFEVLTLRLDPAKGEVRAVLDDGTEEGITDAAMNEGTGRFECTCRGGKARAVFSRVAHQVLLDNLIEAEGEFFLCAGPRTIPVRP
jgi:hypothetical protein